jgi:hypothetical protein
MRIALERSSYTRRSSGRTLPRLVKSMRLSIDTRMPSPRGGKAEGRNNPVPPWEWRKSRTVGPHWADGVPTLKIAAPRSARVQRMVPNWAFLAADTAPFYPKRHSFGRSFGERATVLNQLTKSAGSYMRETSIAALSFDQTGPRPRIFFLLYTRRKSFPV